jgi:hypothetical protein
MGCCASKEVQEIKIAAMERLIKCYIINLIAFMELNYNWSKVNSLENLASWLHKEERELCSITVHKLRNSPSYSPSTS